MSKLARSGGLESSGWGLATTSTYITPVHLSCEKHPREALVKNDSQTGGNSQAGSDLELRLETSRPRVGTNPCRGGLAVLKRGRDGGLETAEKDNLGERRFNSS